MSRVPVKEALPAATVALLRDGTHGLEILLLQRNPELTFLGGAWVFPGGRIDASDFESGLPSDLAGAARRAAVREVHEEAGIRVDPASLVLLSHWIPPPQAPKRFATWFFLAGVDGGGVRVDGEEIHAHRWVRAQEALDAQRAGEIVLAPPTFISIHSLLPFHSTQDALLALPGSEVPTFCPRIVQAPDGEGAYCLYAGDAAYEGQKLDTPGARHRLFMHASGWQYQREGL